MGKLSAELLLPDCPNCGAPGPVAVELSNDKSGEEPLSCTRCNQWFSPGRESEWHRVFDLPEPYRTAYIDCEIRGLTRKGHANGRDLAEEGAKQRVQDAREKLAELRL